MEIARFKRYRLVKLFWNQTGLKLLLIRGLRGIYGILTNFAFKRSFEFNF